MASFAKTMFFVGSVTFLCLIVFPVFAQLPDSVNGSTYDLYDGDLEPAIGKIISMFLGLVGIIAVIAIIYGGFKYIISGGSENEAEKAKHIIMYAVIGLIIIGLAAVLVNFVLGTIDDGVPAQDTNTDDYNVPPGDPIG